LGLHSFGAEPGELGVNPLADRRFLRLLSAFLLSSFRLYARKTKMALTIAFGTGTGENDVPKLARLGRNCWVGGCPTLAANADA